MEPGAQIGVDGSMVQAPSTQIEVKNPSNLDGNNSESIFKNHEGFKVEAGVQLRLLGSLKFLR